MDTPKTLAARQTIVGYSRANDCWFVKVFPYESEGDAKAAAADYLDRLSAPDVGVGLTRYDLTARHSEVSGYTSYHVEPSDDGEWVRHEDVAPLITGMTAVVVEAQQTSIKAIAALAASTAREKAKDEEIKGLRKALEAADALNEQAFHVYQGATIPAMNIHDAAKELGSLCVAYDKARDAALSGRKPDTKEWM